MNSRLLVPAALMFLLFSGCGPKVEDVLAKNRPAYDQLRAQLKSLVAALPAPAPASTTVGLELGPKSGAKLDPLPVYDGKTPARSNTAFFDTQAAADPEAKPAYDLLMTSDLAYDLGYTKVPSTLSESVLKARDKGMGASLQKDLERFRYVVLTRPANYTRSTAVDDNTFAPGSLDLEWFLVDLKSNDVKARGGVQAATDQSVSFVYKNDGERRERLEAFANSTLYTDVRKKIVESLTAQTGGTFIAD